MTGSGQPHIYCSLMQDQVPLETFQKLPRPSLTRTDSQWLSVVYQPVPRIAEGQSHNCSKWCQKNETDKTGTAFYLPKSQPRHRAAAETHWPHGIAPLAPSQFNLSLNQGKAVVLKRCFAFLLLNYSGGPWTPLQAPVTLVSLSAEGSLWLHDTYNGKIKSTW